MNGRGPRHDETANTRQRKLAPLLLLANLGIAACAAAIMLYFDWKPDPTSHETILFIALLAISWIGLLIAAGAVGWLAEISAVLTPAKEKDATRTTEKDATRIDAEFLAKHRMKFYYSGVLANLAAFALVAEVTGGLAGSPFVALLVAFVLTSQQLSRFRMQSGLMFFAGSVAVIAMWKLEPIFSDPPEPAPHGVEIAMVLLAFFGGGLLGWIEKPSNTRGAAS